MSSNQTHLYPLFIFVIGSKKKREMGNGKWEFGKYILEKEENPR